MRQRVLKDLDHHVIRPGEEINFVALSGGATIAFDVAALLGERGIQLANVVTIGGWVQRTNLPTSPHGVRLTQKPTLLPRMAYQTFDIG